MHELIAINANFHGTISQDGFIEPSVEVVLILSQPSYTFDPAGGCIKSRNVSDVRFAAPPEQLIKMAETLTNLAVQANRDIAEAIAKQKDAK